MPARRLRLTIAYDGTDFHGWQVQPGLPTIQGTLEEIFIGIEKAPVHVAGSGRTDAGVHARAQVAAVTLHNPIPIANLRKAVNRLLPASIRILEVAETHQDFHPRYDARQKTYEYVMVRSEICSPFERRYVHHHPYPLDEEQMVRCAALFEGEHDFTAFAAADDRDALGLSKVRTVFRSELERRADRLVFTVTGSGFLKHMVRNMVGVLIETGKGNCTTKTLRAILSEPKGHRCGPTAPACGLTMVNVIY